MRRFLFTTHRWLGLVAGLMILTWCLSGFVFIIQKYFDTRGLAEMNRKAIKLKDFPDVKVTVPQVIATAAERFAVSYYDTKTGELTKREEYTDSYIKVGDFSLPESREVVSSEKGEQMIRVLKLLDDHQVQNELHVLQNYFILDVKQNEEEIL